ncbi:MAG: hypothetical protein ABGW85_07055 [Sulfurimonas sp.]
MHVEEYEFSVIGVLKEGFRRAYGVKWIFIGAVLLYTIIQLVFGLIILTFIPSLAQVVDQIVAILTLPISVGIVMLGINRAREQELHIHDIFNYFNDFPQLLLAYFLMVIFIVVGFMLLVLPGIYLAVAYSFVLPLIVDKKLGVWEAMEISRKTITKQWFSFFGLGIIAVLFLLISAIPFGIGLIWSIPTVYIAYGLLYHRLFDDVDEVNEIEEEVEVTTNKEN